MRTMQTRSGSSQLRLAATFGPLIAALVTTGPVAGAAESPATALLEIVLVEPGSVQPAAVTQWKSERFQAVALVLAEQTDSAAYAKAARSVTEAGLGVYYWVEVARNEKLATTQPRWMASLGMHMDWQARFPQAPEPKAGEVAKAFPWVPIGTREAFDAHLTRIEQLLKRVPSGWRGLLLNDLQGAPSSCGCGNSQCRWAIDYGVRSTATKLAGDDVAARFLAEVRRRTGDKSVIPVWTTECEEGDLPADKHQGQPGTGLCGTVGCAVGTCPSTFTKQWSALAAGPEGPIAVLATHTALQRTRPEFGGGPGWVTNALAYLDRTLPAHGGKRVDRNRLWTVIEGLRPEDEAITRQLAAQAGVGAILVARTKLDQSFEPRMVTAK
jgi:hypothetical protein